MSCLFPMSGTRPDAAAAWQTVCTATLFFMETILNGANFSSAVDDADAMTPLRDAPSCEIEDAAAIACRLHTPAIATTSYEECSFLSGSLRRPVYVRLSTGSDFPEG